MPDTPAVRLASLADVERIVELAREEHAGSRFSPLAFSPASVRETVHAFLHEPLRTLLVTGQGYLFGLVQPLGFSSERAAIEYAWFAKDGQGFALLQAFDQWAVRMGASVVVAHDYTHDRRLAKILAVKHGFEDAGSVLTRKPVRRVKG